MLSNKFDACFVDNAKTFHHFTVEPAPGLALGERGLFFQHTWDGENFVLKNNLLCSYANELKESEDEKSAYRVAVSKDTILEPVSLLPSDGNLGFLCNGALKSDPYRTTPNARLTVSKNNHKWQVNIKASKKIKSGDEIILAYGPGYVNCLKKSLE